MKCLFIVGVCALFAAVNAKNIFSDLDDEKVEELELNEDDLSGINKIARAFIPSFRKPGTPILNPAMELNFCMRDIIHVIRFNRRVGMEMFKQFIAGAMQTIVDEIVGYPKGWRPTWSPTKKPSGAAHTRPHSNGPSGSTISNGPSGGTISNGPSGSTISNGPSGGTISNGPSGGTISNGPSGGTISNGPSGSTIDNANGPTSSAINKFLRRRRDGFHRQGIQNNVDQEIAHHPLGNKNDLEQIVGDQRVGRK